MNNQFQIPTGYTEQAPEAIVERVSSPEFIHYPNQELLNIEMDIFEARKRALQAEAPRTSWLQAATLRRPHQITLQELIDNESYVGGKISSSTGHDRFWLDAKNPAFEQSGVADWYFVHPTADPAAPDQVLRFQTTPTNIHKLYGGKEVPFSLEEQNAFLETAAAYEKAVAKLYENKTPLIH